MNAIKSHAATAVNMNNVFRMSHAGCIACGNEQQNPLALGLVFKIMADDTVSCRYQVQEHHQGYRGVLHGGVAAILVDSAMVNWLQLHGINNAMTAELNLRYHQALAVGDWVDIEAKLVQHRHKIYQLEATLSVTQQLKVNATAKFIQSTELTT